MTSVELGRELEVTPRTVLRDVDALTEAGLPVITHRGNQGGIELGFDYRMRLTGLAADEAEALAVILNRPIPELAALGMADAGMRARAKLLASLPDPVRATTEMAARRYRFDEGQSSPDIVVAALAEAVREARLVRVHKVDGSCIDLQPAALFHGEGGWRIVDAREDVEPVNLARIRHIQVGRPGSAGTAASNQ